MVPQKRLDLTAQEDVGEGLTVREVLLVFEEVVVVVDDFCEDVVVEVVVRGTAAPPPGTRYQFASGSLRQVPAVTPFQPLAAMRPK